MTTLSGSGPGLKRSLGRVVGLLFAAMLVVQTVGVAFALRRKREVSLVPDPASDDVALTSIFGPLEFTSTAQAFRGGTLTCLYGGGILDLRGAVLAPGGATLRIQAFNGGAQILIPASWRLETKILGLGGVADARPQIDRPADAPVLRITGWAMFGGFGVASQGPKDRDDRSFALQPHTAN
ncbi:MAG: cell wall-active antibiotics response protein [Chloroflexota bacterium]|nr:cell wall-active antibiotics response protein [Chloroflexota bacterium]